MQLLSAPAFLLVQHRRRWWSASHPDYRVQQQSEALDGHHAPLFPLLRFLGLRRPTTTVLPRWGGARRKSLAVRLLRFRAAHPRLPRRLCRYHLPPGSFTAVYRRNPCPECQSDRDLSISCIPAPGNGTPLLSAPLPSERLEYVPRFSGRKGPSRPESKVVAFSARKGKRATGQARLSSGVRWSASSSPFFWTPTKRQVPPPPSGYTFRATGLR